MKILHKEGHNVAIWVYSDDGLPLYPLIIPSDTVMELEIHPKTADDVPKSEEMTGEESR